MLLGIAPLNSQLGEFTSSKIDPIRWTAGTAQKWDMFHSIPILSGLKIELLATDGDGKKNVLGPELPGLDKINPKEKIRYHYTFLRMFQNPKNETFKKSYIESLKKIISQKKPEVVNFSIRLHQNFINKIQDIQKGSETSKPIIQTFGPYTLNK